VETGASRSHRLGLEYQKGRRFLFDDLSNKRDTIVVDNERNDEDHNGEGYTCEGTEEVC